MFNVTVPWKLYRRALVQTYAHTHPHQDTHTHTQALTHIHIHRHALNRIILTDDFFVIKFFEFKENHFAKNSNHCIKTFFLESKRK